MDYRDVVEAFFPARPVGTPVPAAVRLASPARRLRDAAEPLATHAIWSPGTNARLAEVGLNFLTGYVGGRAAALGTPVGAVVASAFGWFDPALVVALYDQAAALVSREQLLDLRDAATVASLGALLADQDVTAVADALADAVNGADGTGRPLFSGLRERGRPTDPVHRLWWACDLVREHRGDSHLAAANSCGLGPVEMNILTELWVGIDLLGYTATRGWTAAAMTAALAGLSNRGLVQDGLLTEDGGALRREVEARTDAQELGIVAALGDDLDGICRALDGWGERCVRGGAFPADILKRAAG